MLILGIDPGLANTGWGVVDTNGLRHRPVSYSVITTSPDMTEQMRIHTIATAIGQVADHYHTQYCGIEDIYFTRSKADKNITNSQSAILVAKVIGAISHQLDGKGGQEPGTADGPASAWPEGDSETGPCG